MTIVLSVLVAVLLLWAVWTEIRSRNLAKEMRTNIAKLEEHGTATAQIVWNFLTEPTGRKAPYAKGWRRVNKMLGRAMGLVK